MENLWLGRLWHELAADPLMCGRPYHLICSKPDRVRFALSDDLRIIGIACPDGVLTVTVAAEQLAKND